MGDDARQPEGNPRFGAGSAMTTGWPEIGTLNLLADPAAGLSNSNVSIVYDAGHLIALERPAALINVVCDYIERRETFIVGRQNQVINP